MRALDPRPARGAPSRLRTRALQLYLILCAALVTVTAVALSVADAAHRRHDEIDELVAVALPAMELGGRLASETSQVASRLLLLHAAGDAEAAKAALGEHRAAVERFEAGHSRVLLQVAR